MPNLFPDQSAFKNDIYRGWQQPGVRNVLAVLPTGGGKSVVVADIVRDMLGVSRQAAVIAHRQELVGQLSLHVAEAGVRHRVIAPRPVIAFITALHREQFGRSLIDPNAISAVVGVDTLIARREALAPWATQIGFWTIDEAHHVLTGNKWGAATTLFPNAIGLGVTASPARPDGNGLGRDNDGVFDTMIVGPTMRQLIDMGRLTDYEIVVPKSNFDISRLHVTKSGDFSHNDMVAETERSQIIGDIVAAYLKFAPGKRGITFAVDVESANKIAARYNENGVPAVAISAKTDDALRVHYVKEFRAGRLLQLVNVDLFGEGFDVPAVEVVSMGRPTMSLTVYLQQFGRALRLMAGKTRGLIIDHVYNVSLHGLPDKPRQWSLARRERRSKLRDPDDVPVKTCLNPECLRAYPGTLRMCPHCGFMPVPVGGGRSVEEVDGDLMLLDASVLAQLRANIVLENPADVGARAGNVAGHAAAVGVANRQIERIEAQRRLSATIALWAGYQRAKGRPDDESYRRFYYGAGVDVLSALAMPRADMDTLTERINEWIATND